MNIEEKKEAIVKKLNQAIKMKYKDDFYEILYVNFDEDKIELEYGDGDTCWITFDDVIKQSWKFYKLVEI